MDTKKMRPCTLLLPPPGDEVVRECLDEIERLEAVLAAERDKRKTECEGCARLTAAQGEIAGAAKHAGLLAREITVLNHELNKVKDTPAISPELLIEDLRAALAAARGVVDDMTEHQIVLTDEIARLKEKPREEPSHIERLVESARRKGIVDGENEYARWLDRKGGAFTDGEVEKAVNALQRYRMGRGW